MFNYHSKLYIILSKILGNCPRGYDLTASSQCMCMESGNNVYYFEKISTVTNENACRKTSRNRRHHQYYTFNKASRECKIWTSNFNSKYDPFMWPKPRIQCPLPSGDTLTYNSYIS